jgi:REP element-mobilizing transposase RayT
MTSLEACPTENFDASAPLDVVAYYWRHLPHWHPRGKPLFVAWRVQGSVRWLEQDNIAAVVEDSIQYGATTIYALYSYVVMPNHVHILIEPGRELSAITRALKGYTARQANLLLNRTGQFWQHESFDHWVRNEIELRKLADYIENNPVRAGLVSKPED